jgi:hypothetical protein
MSAEIPADTVSADPPKRRRGGAPRHNANRATDPKFQLRMRAAQRLAARGRRKRQREDLAAAREAIAEVGLEGSPLGERVAMRLAQIETEIGELQRIVDRSGRVRRDLSLSPPYERMLLLIKEDRAELRALVDKLGEIAAAQGAQLPRSVEEAKRRIGRIAMHWPEAIEFRCHFADGTPVDRAAPGDPTAAAAGEAGLDDLGARGPFGGVETHAAPEPAMAHRTPPPHPLDLLHAGLGLPPATESTVTVDAFRREEARERRRKEWASANDVD